MDDLFTGDQTDVIDQNKDYLSELVGEGKKFKTPQELAKAKAESDAFIERLKQENAGMRTELNTQQRLEQLIDKLKPQPVLPQDNQPTDSQNPASTITPEQLEALVTKISDQRDSVRTQKSNLDEVKQTLLRHLGSDYSTLLNTEASKLGLSKDEVNLLAATKPKAFYKLFGISEQKTQTNQSLFSQPPSHLNPSAPTGNTERNKVYYDGIRKSSPSEYWTPKVQNQMHNDAIRLGDLFYT